VRDAVLGVPAGGVVNWLIVLPSLLLVSLAFGVAIVGSLR
jgi:hypothetical protein